MTHYVVHRAIAPEVAEFFIKEAPKGKLNGQTIHDDGEGNLPGYVAEEFMLDIFKRMFPVADIKYVAKDQFDYDITINGHKVDVKSKMRTASGLRADWDVSIAEYTINKQHCDTYAFCSVTFNKAKTIPLDFYFAGVMSKKAFLEKARRLYKGELDGGNILPNGQPFKVRKDCRNLRFSDLNQYDLEVLAPLKRHYDVREL